MTRRREENVMEVDRPRQHRSEETIARIQAITPDELVQAAAYLSSPRLSSLTFQ